MTRVYEHTEVRQQQIVDAARKLIIKYGSENITVKRIARELDLSETAVYRHFKSKKEILSFLIDNIESLLIEDITEATTQYSSSAIKTLEILLLNHISAIEQRRGISFQVIAEIVSLGDKKLNRKITLVIKNYIKYLSNILTGGIKSGEIREDTDVESASIVLFSMIQGLVNLWALSNYEFDPGEKFGSLWQLYCRSIEKK